MSGWGGPLVLFGELFVLALALLAALGVAGFALWLVAQPWAWLFLVGFVPVVLASTYLHRWSRPAPPPLPPDDAPVGFRLVPVQTPARFCDECGSELIAGMCPMCEGHRPPFC